MRPIKLTGQNRVLQEVLRQARKFEYPDLDTLPPPFAAGGGGGAPTVVVAMSDASDVSKRKADIAAAGVDDDQAIQAAINLAGGDGRILLTEGTLNLGGPVFVPNGIDIEGMGGETLITSPATTPITCFDMASNTSLRHVLFFPSNAAHTCVDATGGLSVIDGVTFTGSGARAATGIRKSAASALIVINSFFDFLDVAITCDSGDADFLSVAQCHIDDNNAGIVLNGIAGGFDAAIINNVIRSTGGWGIELIGNVATFIISGNRMNSNGLNSGGGIAIPAAAASGVVSNNAFNSTRNGPDVYCAGSRVQINGNTHTEGQTDSGPAAVHLDGANLCTVQGNVAFDPAFNGVLVEDSLNCQVADNLIHAVGSDATNTYDGVRLTGTTEHSYVHGNKVIASPYGFFTSRYGVADETDLCNIVVGNDLGDPSGYGTDALLQGAQTIIDYPNDPTYGDNFTGCVTSPSSP